MQQILSSDGRSFSLTALEEEIRTIFDLVELGQRDQDWVLVQLNRFSNVISRADRSLLPSYWATIRSLAVIRAKSRTYQNPISILVTLALIRQNSDSKRDYWILKQSGDLKTAQALRAVIGYPSN
jgi:hypothetical protein